MKRSVLVLLSIFLLLSAAAAQNMPNAIKNYLDANYTNAEDGRWQIAPGACDGKKSLLAGDFDGDGQTDYLVRIKTGKTPKTTRIYLLAFFNQKGEFKAQPFYEAAYTDDLLNSSSSIIKKGTTVSLGLGAEGEGPSMALPTDGIAQYICETDAVKTFIYKNGEMKDLQELARSEDLNFISRKDSAKTISVATPTQKTTNTTATGTPNDKQVPKQKSANPGTLQKVNTPANTNPSTPQATVTNVIPDLNGKWKIIAADGKATPDTTGTVSYEGTVIVFEVKTSSSQKRATAYAEEGKIHTGWGTIGTVSANGKTISWSNKTSWVRQ